MLSRRRSISKRARSSQGEDRRRILKYVRIAELVERQRQFLKFIEHTYCKGRLKRIANYYIIRYSVKNTEYKR